MLKEELSVLLDGVLSTEEGRSLVKARWKATQERLAYEARSARLAEEAARKAAPPPLEGWDCTACGWLVILRTT